MHHAYWHFKICQAPCLFNTPQLFDSLEYLALTTFLKKLREINDYLTELLCDPFSRNIFQAFNVNFPVFPNSKKYFVKSTL